LGLARQGQRRREGVAQPLPAEVVEKVLLQLHRDRSGGFPKECGAGIASPISFYD
jgi:hypothetical protein